MNIHPPRRRCTEEREYPWSDVSPSLSSESLPDEAARGSEVCCLSLREETVLGDGETLDEAIQIGGHGPQT
jgi:hypothetical protein